ncbi:MAG: BatD family protein, partial [Bacteroidota bacterium]|nr:BatD family protein [Bacteroidota bacterium]
KVRVDRHACFVGEPVVATFKLYSRLESRSEIVKNPGFYGFGVHDMISLVDKVRTTETVQGRAFDVHTIRKVQLYALQPGTFIIDAMELENKVEFSRSVINKKTEQEVVEEMYGGNHEEKQNGNTEVYETTLQTEPVSVVVKPLPVKNLTESFAGAVGDFTMEAALTKDQLAKNEESFLLINIHGKGNFTQLVSPAIEWPNGVESFEPTAKEVLDKSQIPLAGTKIFRYAFVSSQPGVYKIPSIYFSFFDVKKKDYKTILTQPLQVKVLYSQAEKKPLLTHEFKRKGNRVMWWRIAAMVFLAILLITGWIIKKQKQNKNSASQLQRNGIETATIENDLMPVSLLSIAGNKTFYREIDYAVWKYFNKKLNVAGSEMTKTTLTKKLNAAGINASLIDELMLILQQCETGMYSDTDLEINRKDFFLKVENLLKQVNESLK